MMRPRLLLAIVGALALGANTGADAVASTQRAPVVRVQPTLGPAGAVGVSFVPAEALPAGGYYYGVIVLRPYKHYTRAAPPPCAVSSDMQRADYGYAPVGHAVDLALTRAASIKHRWCSGGEYVGAIYAVPHAPPCNGATLPQRSSRDNRRSLSTRPSVWQAGQ